MTPNPLREAAQALICERLLNVGHVPGTDVIWWVRLMVSRAVRALLLRLGFRRS